jgi:hypothetical protein
LLEEAGEGGSADVKELREARSTIDANEQTIREVLHPLPCLIRQLTPSSIGKSPSWRASSSPRSTEKTSLNNAPTTSSVSSIDYARTINHPSMVMGIAATARLLRQGRITTTDVNYVKVHIVWMLVLYSRERLWMMYQRTRLEERSVRIARYVLQHLVVEREADGTEH